MVFESLMEQKTTNLVGKRGEQSAASYLKKNGYKILATNFCNSTGRRLGEIDIIAKQNQEIVFIEVKTRLKSVNYILPEENINRHKLYKLNKVATYYLSKNNLIDAEFRFDAISIVAEPEKNSATLRHLKNIFY